MWLSEPYLLKVSSKYTEIAGSALHRCIFVPYMTMVISYVLISIERVFGFIDNRWFHFSKCFRITELSVPLVNCNGNTIQG